jgi:hypothetical protein
MPTATSLVKGTCHVWCTIEVIKAGIYSQWGTVNIFPLLNCIIKILWVNFLCIHIIQEPWYYLNLQFLQACTILLMNTMTWSKLNDTLVFGTYTNNSQIVVNIRTSFKFKVLVLICNMDLILFSFKCINRSRPMVTKFV